MKNLNSHDTALSSKDIFHSFSLALRSKLVCMFLFIIIVPLKTRAQENGAVVATVGALAAIGVGIAAAEQMKERAELTATQWVLTNRPDLKSFSLKTIDFDGKKIKDMSSVSVITFKIQKFQPMDDPALDGEKYVLLGFTSHGWINEYGIDFNKVKWFMLDVEEWTKMMESYVRVASGVNTNLKEDIIKGKIVNKGVRVKGKKEIPFYKLSGDMYVVTDYSNEMKFVYNEKSLGIFLKETSDLVQIGRGSLIEIHEFFFEDIK